jgi:hypothetical protein
MGLLLIPSERDARYWWSMIFSENRYSLFGIMLYDASHWLNRSSIWTIRSTSH